MTIQPTSPSKSSLFLSVFLRPQSYLNLAYLLLAFPLGAAYFVFLAAGLSVGSALVVVWVGIPVLVLVLGVAHALGRLERALATGMLGHAINVRTREKTRTPDADLSAAERRMVGAWRRSKKHLSDPLTWSALLYLLLKLPIGLVSFLMAVALLSVTLVLVGTPAFFLVWGGEIPALNVSLASIEEFLQLNPGDLAAFETALSFNGFGADALWESIVFAVAGIPMALVTLHVLNGIAFAWGRWTRLMLGDAESHVAMSGQRDGTGAIAKEETQAAAARAMDVEAPEQPDPLLKAS